MRLWMEDDDCSVDNHFPKHRENTNSDVADMQSPSQPLVSVSPF
jgi:hypothetical protein